MEHEQITKLKQKARTLRKHIIEMTTEAGSGHPGGSLGMADIFSALYFHFLKLNTNKPNDENRDYLVLSNGHICPVLYAAMAEKGFFPTSKLKTLRKLNSPLQGHPHRETLPGLETTSGPLGSGISQASGMALGLKMDKKKNKVICITSDGEHDEGNTWEAIMFAHKYHLNNLTVIVDRNRIQLSGKTEEIMPLKSLKEKYLSFGWGVIEIDGNDMKQVVHALENTFKPREKPLVIIANTTLGKGVKFMENNYEWHGKAPTKEQAIEAIKQIEGKSP